jgi:hypothetical protein
VTDNDSKEEKEDAELENRSVNVTTDSYFVEGFDLHLQFLFFNVLLFNRL